MREKLIELTNDVLKYLPWGQISSHTAKEIADHLIANGVTIQKWIPVAERLPERNGDYLVCTFHDFYKTTKIAKASFKSNSGGFYGQGGHWSNVTHWMPLPEPPKGAA